MVTSSIRYSHRRSKGRNPCRVCIYTIDTLNIYVKAKQQNERYKYLLFSIGEWVGAQPQWIYCSGPFYQHWLTLIPTWISNHTRSEVWDKITSPFPNFNGATVAVWEWISNFIPHYILDVITYPATDTPYLTLTVGCIWCYVESTRDGFVLSFLVVILSLLVN